MAKKKKDNGHTIPEDHVLEIQAACSALGWSIAMNDTEEGVCGLVIGGLSYVEEVISQLEEYEDYEIWSKPDAH